MRFISIFFLLLATFPVSGACPFCTRANIDPQLVTETEKTLVLYCLTPATEGNLLVIPKRHMTRFEELQEDELGDIYHLIQKVQAVFQQHYLLSDYLIVQKNGKNAGQSVDHIHFHVIPCPEDFDPQTVFKYRPRLTPEEMKERVNSLKPYFQEEDC